MYNTHTIKRLDGKNSISFLLENGDLYIEKPKKSSSSKINKKKTLRLNHEEMKNFLNILNELVNMEGNTGEDLDKIARGNPECVTVGTDCILIDPSDIWSPMLEALRTDGVITLYMWKSIFSFMSSMVSTHAWSRYCKWYFVMGLDAAKGLRDFIKEYVDGPFVLD